MKIVAIRIVRFNREFVTEHVRTSAERAREWRKKQRGRNFARRNRSNLNAVGKPARTFLEAK